MIKLSKRLKQIVNFVNPENTVIDVGTDHGFVPNFLYEEGICREIIASDISESSLEKSRVFTRLRGNERKIPHICTNGLQGIPPMDTIIIAGMGGILISRIIEKDLETCKKAKQLILQPMQGSDVLRQFLGKQGFCISEEALVYEDQRYFEIMVASHSGEQQIISTMDSKISPLLRRDNPLELRGFILEKMEFNRNIVENMVYKTEKAKRRKEELKEEIKELQVILDELPDR